MEYRTLGRTGLKVSELCLGTMTFGWGADEPTSHAIMDRAFEAGINFLDTADVYSFWAENNDGGVSETWIGNWLKGKDRRQVVIATKVRGRMWDGPNGEGLSRAHIMAAVEDSLRRLGTDYVDLYQTHWPDDETPLEETLRALDDLVRQGKVRYVGCSNHPAWLLTKALWLSDVNGLARYDSLQPHYNLVHRDEFERELKSLCVDQGLGVIPYSPLEGGFLTGKYRPGTGIPPGSRGQGSESIKGHLTESNFALLDRMAEIGYSARPPSPRPSSARARWSSLKRAWAQLASVSRQRRWNFSTRPAPRRLPDPGERLPDRGIRDTQIPPP
jgi:aryl-alcohol dehydrogenase-like predicted oxidoreductase